MARESFDKEVQFLRLLALAGGAYSRQQFASRLGISVHTYDKTLRYLKDMRTSLQPLSANQESDLTEGLRYNHYESADPLLLFLFRAKSLKESESVRLSLTITLLQDRELTAKELLDECSDNMPLDFPCPDEKTIRGDLKYLEEVGVITRCEGGRPYRYRAANDLVDHLSDDELLDLYDYVDVMANTQVPAVQGYLLRDTLKKALGKRGFLADEIRLLAIGDEAVVVGRFGVFQNPCKLLEVAGPQEMVDVREGRFRQKAQSFGFDGQNILSLESVDRDEIGAELAIGRVVRAKGKEIGGACFCHDGTSLACQLIPG